MAVGVIGTGPAGYMSAQTSQSAYMLPHFEPPIVLESDSWAAPHTVNYSNLV